MQRAIFITSLGRESKCGSCEHLQEGTSLGCKSEQRWGSPEGVPKSRFDLEIGFCTWGTVILILKHTPWKVAPQIDMRSHCPVDKRLLAETGDSRSPPNTSLLLVLRITQRRKGKREPLIPLLFSLVPRTPCFCRWSWGVGGGVSLLGAEGREATDLAPSSYSARRHKPRPGWEKSSKEPTKNPQSSSTYFEASVRRDFMGRLGGGGPKHPVTRGKEPGQNLLSWGQSRPSQAVCDCVYPSRLLTKRNVGRARVGPGTW